VAFEDIVGHNSPADRAKMSAKTSPGAEDRYLSVRCAETKGTFKLANLEKNVIFSFSATTFWQCSVIFIKVVSRLAFLKRFSSLDNLQGSQLNENTKERRSSFFCGEKCLDEDMHFFEIKKIDFSVLRHNL